MKVIFSCLLCLVSAIFFMVETARAADSGMPGVQAKGSATTMGKEVIRTNDFKCWSTFNNLNSDRVCMTIKGLRRETKNSPNPPFDGYFVFMYLPPLKDGVKASILQPADQLTVISYFREKEHLGVICAEDQCKLQVYSSDEHFPGFPNAFSIVYVANGGEDLVIARHDKITNGCDVVLAGKRNLIPSLQPWNHEWDFWEWTGTENQSSRQKIANGESQSVGSSRVKCVVEADPSNNRIMKLEFEGVS